MFFNPLLLDVLAGRGIEHIDTFLKDPTWNDLPDPMSVEVSSLKRRWVRLRQGRYSVEALCWDLDLREGIRGDCLIEFYGKRRILRGFSEQ